MSKVNGIDDDNIVFMSRIKEVYASEHEGKVWKIYYDPVSPYILCEVRVEEERKAEFFIYDLQSFKKRKLVLGFDEDWWLGIHDFYNGMIVFHLYQDGIEPIPSGLILFDSNENTINYENAEASFLERNGSLLLFQVGDEELTQSIDLGHGGNVTAITEPLYYSAESTHYQTIKDFIQQMFQLEIEAGVEYLEYRNLILLSFNSISNMKLKNVFCVLHEDGELIWKETLVEDVKGTGLGTFFVDDDNIWLVKNKTQLKVLKIE